VSREGPLPPARAIHIVRQVCESLAEAHVAGLVHRDIKPANIHVGRLGLTYDFEGNSSFDLLASYRRTWLNARGLEWRTDLALGRTTGILSELYQPFSAGSPFFVAPYVDARQFPVDIYDGNRRFARFLFRYARGGTDLGVHFGQYGEARVGVLAGSLNAKLDSGPLELVGEDDTVRQGAFTARLFFDQLDSMTFPRNGAAAHVDLYASRPGLGAADSYTKVSALGDVARSFGDNTFTLGFAAGKKTGKSEVPDYDLFTLGGFLRLSGYPTDALLGDKLEFARFQYYRRLARQTLLDGVYAGFSLETGKMGGRIFPTQPTGWIRAGSVYLGLDTFLGPLYLGFGRASPGYNAFYLYLGRPWKAY